MRSTNDDTDSAIRVVVAPSQSSYFAGELFSVTITITNTRSHESVTPRTRVTSHRRAASHSISSAPLARPPTSPGTPRTAIPNPLFPHPPTERNNIVVEVPRRLGLIGRDAQLQASSLSSSLQSTAATGSGTGSEGLQELMDQRRKRQLAKSQSVSLSLQELEENLGEAAVVQTPSGSRMMEMGPSSLARLDTLNLGPDHPHARKQSLLDGQRPPDFFAGTTSSGLVLQTTSSSATTSASSLPLDPILEGTLSSYPTSPTVSSVSGENSPRASISAYPYFAAPTQLLRPPQRMKRNQRPTSSAASNTKSDSSELILYSYAQLKGTLTLTASTLPHAFRQSPEQCRKLNATRSALLKRRAVVGGGSMDIPISLQNHLSKSRGTLPPHLLSLSAISGTPLSFRTTTTTTSMSNNILGAHRKPPHSRSSSLSASLLSFFSPSSLSTTFTSSAPASPVLPTGTGTFGVAGPPPPPMPRRTSLNLGMNYSTRKAHVHPVLENGNCHPDRPAPDGGGVGLGLGLIGNGNSNKLGPGGRELRTDELRFQEEVEIIPEDVPLPTFEVAPTMLAVDLKLEPGESRTYVYTLPLPQNLPPTFKGRSMRFSYEVLVGICRATTSAPFARTEPAGLGEARESPSAIVAANNSISRVMKVPVRVYNHVSVNRPTGSEPYDLLWPVSKPPQRQRQQAQAKVVELTALQPAVGAGDSPQKDVLTTSSPFPSSAASSFSISVTSPGARVEAQQRQGGGTLAADELKEYGRRLLRTFSTPAAVENEDVDHDAGSKRDPDSRRRLLQRDMEWVQKEENDGDSGGSGEGDLYGGLTGGCREAVEILTRNSRKASYDVTKDGVKVAVLTFTKAAYRLGESVLGVVEINERKGRSRVLKLSAMLEAHEILPSAFFSALTSTTAAAAGAGGKTGSGSGAKSLCMLKRVHSEHHSSFVLNTLRTTFALDIPADASPAFEVCVDGSGNGGVVDGGWGSEQLRRNRGGGLEWKVRLCLLVAVANDHAREGPEGVRFKSLVRDGRRGPWASRWKPSRGMVPLEKVEPVVEKVAAAVGCTVSGGANADQNTGRGGIMESVGDLGEINKSQHATTTTTEEKKTRRKTWGEVFASAVSLLAGENESLTTLWDDDRAGENKEEHLDDDSDGYDGIKPDMAGGVGRGVKNFGGGEKGWKPVNVEMVECEVPVRVWPAHTAFRSADVVFDV